MTINTNCSVDHCSDLPDAATNSTAIPHLPSKLHSPRTRCCIWCCLQFLIIRRYCAHEIVAIHMPYSDRFLRSSRWNSSGFFAFLFIIEDILTQIGPFFLSPMLFADQPIENAKCSLLMVSRFPQSSFNFFIPINNCFRVQSRLACLAGQRVSCVLA